MLFIYYYFFGDIMKKLKPIFMALFLGTLFAFIIFNESTKDTYAYQSYNALIIQIGVFTKEEYALDMCKKYGGIISYEDNVYKVYFSILSRETNIDFIRDYLNNMKINYYLKKAYIDDRLLSMINNYEEAMEKSSDDKTKLEINNEILKIYKDRG